MLHNVFMLTKVLARRFNSLRLPSAQQIDDQIYYVMDE